MKKNIFIKIDTFINDLNAIEGNCTKSVIKGIINNQPIIDVVEVIRCKNCKNGRIVVDWYRIDNDVAIYCDYWEKVFKEEDYCSKGKSKVGNKSGI